MSKNNNFFKSSLLKWTMVGGIVAVAAISVSTYFLISCKEDDNGPEEPLPKNVEDVIKENTFRLRFHGSLGWYCSGTAWILNKDWQINGNNYMYYLATNWHVTEYNKSNFQTQVPYSTFDQMAISFSQKNSESVKDGDYTIIEGANQSNNFGIVTPNVPNYPVLTWGIDLSIIKVDLKPYLSTDNLQERLDTINSEAVAPGTKLHNVRLDYKECNQNNKYYIGGYPAGTGSAIWQQHELSSSALVNDRHWIFTKKDQFQIEQDVSGGTIYDSQPQYRFSREDKSWMGGGSSGSMIIDSDLNICGIFWGGQMDSYFHPMASIFGNKLNPWQPA